MPDVKQPPHSMEAEQAILGGIFIQPAAYDRASSIVNERDFYPDYHRKIFRAISHLIEKSQPVDMVTVAEYLQSHNELEKVGGLKYLSDLAMNTPSAANIVRYAEIVRDRSLMRKVIGASFEIEERGYNPTGMTGKDVLDFAQAKIMAISETAVKATGGPQHVGDVMTAVIERVDELYHRDNHGEITGLPTGFEELDKLTTGMQPGELIVVAARPSMGKTALALNIMEHVALDSKKNVAFFSLEMVNHQLGVRLLSSVSRINQQRVKSGRIYDAEWQRITDALGKLKFCGIWLDEESTLTVNEIRARARLMQRESGGLSLVVVDYLQLIQGTGKTDNRAYEVAEISRGLKLLAKELMCPVIALSQLNRGLEQRPNRRPIMSDLRDSGGIEQDADWIVFIYRDEVYNPDSPDKGIAELIIGKQRNGPTGTVFVNFKGDCTRFDNRPKHEPIPSHEIRHEKRSSRAGGNSGHLSARKKDYSAGADPEF